MDATLSLDCAFGAAAFLVSRFLIDGEAVVCCDNGVSDFERLHSRQHDATVFLYAFDLLALDGAGIRREELDDRRTKLRKLLARPDGIRFSEHLAGDDKEVFRHACKLGLEGIASNGAMPPIYLAGARLG